MGLTPGAETQGGSTYCAVASLTLLGVLHELGEEALESLLKWCLSRQVNGYNGRTNKECDSCYSFWIAGTLKLLNHFDDTDFNSTKTFLLDKCQQYKRYFGFL
jgi:geranylgeranyl transferase type-1 subunit beta